MAVSLFWKPAPADSSEIGPYRPEPADKFTVTKGLTLVELHQKATLHGKKDAFIPELWNMAEAGCGMDFVWFREHLTKMSNQAKQAQVKRMKQKMEQDEQEAIAKQGNSG